MTSKQYAARLLALTSAYNAGTKPFKAYVVETAAVWAAARAAGFQREVGRLMVPSIRSAVPGKPGRFCIQGEMRYLDPATQAWRTVQEPMPQTRREQAEYVNRVQTQAFNAAGAR